MVRSGFLIAAGTLAVLATSTTICLELMTYVNAAQEESLLLTCVIAAVMQSIALFTLSVLGLMHLLPAMMPKIWASSKIAFVMQLLVCIAATSTSAVAMAYLQQSISMSGGHNSPNLDRKRHLLVGLGTALAVSALTQLGFFSLNFASNRAIVLGRSSSSSSSSSYNSTQEGRKLHMQNSRGTHTTPAIKEQEMTSTKANVLAPSSPRKALLGHISAMRASRFPAVRPSSSRTRLLASESRRPGSADSLAARSSVDTSFDSWDTSSVDVHNRQVVMNLSGPAAFKTALETIPASPAESRPRGRPSTPFDLEDLVASRPSRNSRSRAGTLQSQQERNRPSSSATNNELDIHPLFRQSVVTSPIATSAGTNVLAAPNAGQVIPRPESAQSRGRFRNSELLSVHQVNSKGAARRVWLDEELGSSHESELKSPVPAFLFSPSVQASLDFMQAQEE